MCSIFAVCGGVVQVLWEEYQCQTFQDIKQVVEESEYGAKVVDFLWEFQTGWQTRYDLPVCKLTREQKQWFGSEILDYEDLNHWVFLCLSQHHIELIDWMFFTCTVPTSVFRQVNWDMIGRYMTQRECDFDGVMWIYHKFSLFTLASFIFLRYSQHPTWYKLKPYWSKMRLYVSDILVAEICQKLCREGEIERAKSFSHIIDQIDQYQVEHVQQKSIPWRAEEEHTQTWWARHQWQQHPLPTNIDLLHQ